MKLTGYVMLKSNWTEKKVCSLHVREQAIVLSHTGEGNIRWNNEEENAQILYAIGKEVQKRKLLTTIVPALLDPMS